MCQVSWSKEDQRAALRGHLSAKSGEWCFNLALFKAQVKKRLRGREVCHCSTLIRANGVEKDCLSGGMPNLGYTEVLHHVMSIYKYATGIAKHKWTAFCTRSRPLKGRHRQGLAKLLHVSRPNLPDILLRLLLCTTTENMFDKCLSWRMGI